MKDKATILLVDDKEMALAVGQAMIARLGHDVLTAISGREAIEKYQENQDRIDLVILDVVMPEMDGADTYEKLRKINPDVKVILSTGYGINGKAREMLNRGCNAFIQKPFSINQLSEKIREVLDKN